MSKKDTSNSLKEKIKNSIISKDTNVRDLIEPEIMAEAVTIFDSNIKKNIQQTTEFEKKMSEKFILKPMERSIEKLSKLIDEVINLSIMQEENIQEEEKVLEKSGIKLNRLDLLKEFIDEGSLKELKTQIRTELTNEVKEIAKSYNELEKQKNELSELEKIQRQRNNEVENTNINISPNNVKKMDQKKNKFTNDKNDLKEFAHNVMDEIRKEQAKKKASKEYLKLKPTIEKEESLPKLSLKSKYEQLKLKEGFDVYNKVSNNNITDGYFNNEKKEDYNITENDFEHRLKKIDPFGFEDEDENEDTDEILKTIQIQKNIDQKLLFDSFHSDDEEIINFKTIDFFKENNTQYYSEHEKTFEMNLDDQQVENKKNNDDIMKTIEIQKAKDQLLLKEAMEFDSIDHDENITSEINYFDFHNNENNKYEREFNDNLVNKEYVVGNLTKKELKAIKINVKKEQNYLKSKIDDTQNQAIYMPNFFDKKIQYENEQKNDVSLAQFQYIDSDFDKLLDKKIDAANKKEKQLLDIASKMDKSSKTNILDVNFFDEKKYKFKEEKEIVDKLNKEKNIKKIISQLDKQKTKEITILQKAFDFDSHETINLEDNKTSKFDKLAEDRMNKLLEKDKKEEKEIIDQLDKQKTKEITILQKAFDLDPHETTNFDDNKIFKPDKLVEDRINKLLEKDKKEEEKIIAQLDKQKTKEIAILQKAFDFDSHETINLEDNKTSKFDKLAEDRMNKLLEKDKKEEKEIIDQLDKQKTKEITILQKAFDLDPHETTNFDDNKIFKPDKLVEDRINKLLEKDKKEEEKIIAQLDKQKTKEIAILQKAFDLNPHERKNLDDNKISKPDELVEDRMNRLLEKDKKEEEKIIAQLDKQKRKEVEILRKAFNFDYYETMETNKEIAHNKFEKTTKESIKIINKLKKEKSFEEKLIDIQQKNRKREKEALKKIKDKIKIEQEKIKINLNKEFLKEKIPMFNKPNFDNPTIDEEIDNKIDNLFSEINNKTKEINKNIDIVAKKQNRNFVNDLTKNLKKIKQPK